jgi:hypothetical protein
VSVARAISAAEINLTLGGKDLDHSVRQQVTKQSRISPLLFLCVSSSSQLLLFCDRRRPRRQLDLAGRFRCEGTLPRKIKRVPNPRHRSILCMFHSFPWSFFFHAALVRPASPRHLEAGQRRRQRSKQVILSSIYYLGPV